MRSLTLIALLFLSSPAFAAAPTYGYFSLEPDIVTNYINEKNTKRLAYVRMSIDLMLESVAHVEIAEHHAPLLRATVIEIVGRQRNLKSAVTKKKIINDVKKRLNELMFTHARKRIIKRVIITKFLVQD